MIGSKTKQRKEFVLNSKKTPSYLEKEHSGFKGNKIHGRKVFQCQKVFL